MKIEKVQRNTEHRITIRVAKFTTEDIKNIIRKELKAEGFDTQNVNIDFHVGSEFTADKRDMNRKIVLCFQGASASWEVE